MLMTNTKTDNEQCVIYLYIYKKQNTLTKALNYIKTLKDMWLDNFLKKNLIRMNIRELYERVLRQILTATMIKSSQHQASVK